VTLASQTDIYNDGTYLKNNPDAHVADSFFKFAQLLPLLDKIPTQQESFSILDIGGGAGVLGHLVSLYFHHRGLEVRTTAADISVDMLELQRINNPFIVETVAGDTMAATARGAPFDLTLAIDVFEHMPDYHPALQAIQKASTWLLCNMPIERNLFDILRNIYLRNRYYAEQTRSIGHLHFFSYGRHLREFRDYFDVVCVVFSPYWRNVLQVRSPEHEQQLQSRPRRAELQISRWISALVPWAAPWIIQGSCFSLSKTSKLH
jgi:hypothetical protein